MMDHEERMISVDGLRRSFKDVAVLRGVSFEVRRGSIFALLGSNGAGKTTLIRIMSTLLRPDAGSVRIGGFDVVGSPKEVRSLISLTGQFAAVDEIMTGRENLMMMAKLRCVADPKATVRAMIERFGMTDYADRRVSEYSGGMRRRIDIAMSLIGDPELIFLDEPTTGLDPEARLEVWDAIRALRQGGTTIFLTTQYLEEAEQLADEIAILGQGIIIAEGTLEELRRLFPPTKREYVEKQPTLEEIFFAITNGAAGAPTYCQAHEDVSEGAASAASETFYATKNTTADHKEGDRDESR